MWAILKAPEMTDQWLHKSSYYLHGPVHWPNLKQELLLHHHKLTGESIYILSVLITSTLFLLYILCVSEFSPFIVRGKNWSERQSQNKTQDR